MINNYDLILFMDIVLHHFLKNDIELTTMSNTKHYITFNVIRKSKNSEGYSFNTFDYDKANTFTGICNEFYSDLDHFLHKEISEGL